MTWKLPAYTWGKERELCRRCKHYRERVSDVRHAQPSVVMVCNLNTKRTGGKDRGTCIDSRYDGPCSRKGKLFEPA